MYVCVDIIYVCVDVCVYVRTWATPAHVPAMWSVSRSDDDDVSKYDPFSDDNQQCSCTKLQSVLRCLQTVH